MTERRLVFHDAESYHDYLNRCPNRFGGAFICWPADPDKQLIIPNSLVLDGEKSLLRMITQGAVDDVALGGNFWIGLCSLNFGDITTTLAGGGPAGEPTATHGYARQSVSRDGVGWPAANLVQINNLWKAATKQVVFTAAGGDFSASISRAFLATTSDNTGKLIAVGGALPAPLAITNGTSFPAQYELYMK